MSPAGNATFGDERGGGIRYLQALREHWLLIALVVLVAVVAAAAYSTTAQKRYEAHAKLLVTPVPAGDPTYLGLPVITAPTDQSRVVITASNYVTIPQVAERVARDVGLPSAAAALNSVSVTPLGQSNVIGVLGIGRTAPRAAAIANAFARETVALRTELLQTQLRKVIQNTRAQLAQIPAALQNGAEALTLQARVANLQALVGAPDPTISVLSDATEPAGPVWPRPVLSVLVAFIASLLLGLGAAIALELVNPRVNREDELLLEQRLPILARVPRMPRRRVRAYLAGKEPLPGDVREAYRTLRAGLAASHRGDRMPGSILITSAVPGEGKTMTSVNLAVTLALAGLRVILVDGDLRRPMIATVFGVPTTSRGFATLLEDRATAEEALVPAQGYGENLRLLLASPEHAQLVDLLDPDRVDRVLTDLRLDADVVIVDSPPLTEVADALSLAASVDAVIVAVRLGRTRRDRLNELRRMVAQRGISLLGFVVTTRNRRRGQGYYYGRSSEQEAGDGETKRAPALIRGGTGATSSDDDF